jgi:hypothetical protein
MNRVCSLKTVRAREQGCRLQVQALSRSRARDLFLVCGRALLLHDPPGWYLGQQWNGSLGRDLREERNLRHVVQSPCVLFPLKTLRQESERKPAPKTLEPGLQSHHKNI